MNTFKKIGLSFVNKKREFKKTGRMNEISDEETLSILRKLGGSRRKLRNKPLVDASSDSIVDPPFLEVYEDDFNSYRRERTRI